MIFARTTISCVFLKSKYTLSSGLSECDRRWEPSVPGRWSCRGHAEHAYYSYILYDLFCVPRISWLWTRMRTKSLWWSTRQRTWWTCIIHIYCMICSVSPGFPDRERGWEPSVRGGRSRREHGEPVPVGHHWSVLRSLAPQRCQSHWWWPVWSWFIWGKLTMVHIHTRFHYKSLKDVILIQTNIIISKECKHCCL